MKKEMIITATDEMKGELSEYCSKKNIKLLSAKGSTIEIVTLYLAHDPLLVIVDDKDYYCEVCQALTGAGHSPRFAIISNRNRGDDQCPGINYVRKGDVHELITLIREAQLENITDNSAFNEAFELYADNHIYEILGQLGFRLKNAGTRYLHDIITMMCKGRYDTTSMITKEIYPAIARRYKTTPMAIERNLRTAIGNYWDNRKSMDCFGDIMLPLAENNVIPSNKETVHYIANRVIFELNAKKAELRKQKMKTI